MINSTWLDLENNVLKKAEGHSENVRNDIFEAVDVGAVEPNGEKTFNYVLIIPQVPISSNNDEKDSIKNSYKISVKVCSSSLISNQNQNQHLFPFLCLSFYSPS